MDFRVVNEKILKLISLNEDLENISYSDPRYDELEDKVYGLQDEINDNYGKKFDEIMSEVYKQLGSKDEILNFTDYVAKTYLISGSKLADGSLKFDEVPEDCISITVRPEALQGKKVDGKIYLKPNPLRIGFAIGKHERIVWSSEEV
jgi:uncharacterized protein YlaN (UPF0358 family)